LRNGMIRAQVMVAIASAIVLPSSSYSQMGQGDVQHTWQQYIRAPQTPIARPIRIVSTSGTVENAEALLTPEAGRVAVLTRKAGDTEPTHIVLDYGIEVGGVPSFEVVAARIRLRPARSDL